MFAFWKANISYYLSKQVSRRINLRLTSLSQSKSILTFNCFKIHNTVNLFRLVEPLCREERIQKVWIWRNTKETPEPFYPYLKVRNVTAIQTWRHIILRSQDFEKTLSKKSYYILLWINRKHLLCKVFRHKQSRQKS